MEQNWMQLLDQQNQLSRVMETNRTAQTYGLMLSEQDAKLLLKERGRALKKEKRVEFGEGILPKMIYEFCDCPYLNQEHYVETLVRLQDIFYLYKNEMLDEITDDELLNFMREQYETVCFWGSGLSGGDLSGYFRTGDPGRIQGISGDGWKK